MDSTENCPGAPDGKVERHFIRCEGASDVPAIRRVNVAAFGRVGEADLVDALRRSGVLVLSQVAVMNEEIVGHVGFSPVTIERTPVGFRAVGLAPVAVLPEHQRRGIAAALIRRGLAECGALGYQGIVVLGDPRYYSRFGFVPAAQFNLRCAYDVPADAFMALSLNESGFAGCSGLVRYASAFAIV
jgi:putative acetyltransferase